MRDGRRLRQVLGGLMLTALMLSSALPVPVRAAGAAGGAAGVRETTGTAPAVQAVGAPDAATAAARTGVPAPEITSPSAVLMEAQSGRILFAKNPRERRNPASVTKIMTMLVAYDAIREGRARWDDPVTTSERAKSQGGTQVLLEVGEVNPLGALLKAVSVGSANDAAVAVAEHLGGSHEGFVAMMNERARQLGLRDTQFRNATGFDAPGHYSTAHDLAVIGRELVRQHPQVLKHSKIFYERFQHPDGRETEMLNRNRLVHFYDWIDGLKTGWTSASGYSVVVTGQRRGTRMIAVILGAPDSKTRQAEALRLLEYGFAHFTTVTLAPAGRPLARIPVIRGASREVAAVSPVPVAVTVARGEEKRVKFEVTRERRLLAPVQKGQGVGQVVAKVDGREVGRFPLTAAEAVPRIGLWGSFQRSLGRFFGTGHTAGTGAPRGTGTDGPADPTGGER